MFLGHRRHKLPGHQPPGVHAAQVWLVHRGRGVTGAAACMPRSFVQRGQVRAGGWPTAVATSGAEQRGQVSVYLSSADSTREARWVCNCVLQITQERPGECVTVFCRSHKRLKRMLFNRTKQDKTCKFSRKTSFSSYVQHKNRRS